MIAPGIAVALRVDEFPSNFRRWTAVSLVNYELKLNCNEVPLALAACAGFAQSRSRFRLVTCRTSVATVTIFFVLQVLHGMML